MANRTTSYRRVQVKLTVDTSGSIAVTKVFEASQQVVQVAVVSLPSAYLGYAGEPGLGFLRMHVGEGADPIRINQQGTSWSAPIDPATGLQIPETTGVFFSADAPCPNVVNVELHIELLAVPGAH